MPDVMTPEQRRLAMSHNRGRTRPEKRLASFLWSLGFRYFTGSGYKSLCRKAIKGNPDLIFPSARTVVFVDGCFWHGCPKCKGIPTTSGKFWEEKIRNNIERDRRVTKHLQEEGWTVLRVWEHELKRREDLTATAEAIGRTIKRARVDQEG